QAITLMSTGMALWKLPCQRKQVLDGCGTSLSRESKLNTDTRDHCSQGCRDQTASEKRLGLLPYARQPKEREHDRRATIQVQTLLSSEPSPHCPPLNHDLSKPVA
ncbi:mCG66409, partial [Mus musculus]